MSNYVRNYVFCNEKLHCDFQKGNYNDRMSEWNSFQELRQIPYNIANLGYTKEYINKHKLEENKKPHWSDMTNGTVCYYEPIEVKIENGEILWRNNEDCVRIDVPDFFGTQFGVFNNHNHGEFASWIEKDVYNVTLEEGKERTAEFNREDFFIEGNYCDMFDCGEYTYAISNLMHMFSGKFKIVRLDANLDVVTMYDNYHNNDCTRLEYMGYFQNEKGYIILASGIRELGRIENKKESQEVTIVFQIDEAGNCNKIREFNIAISSANSRCAIGNCVFWGQNKMVTCLNLINGEVSFFTDKTDEEIAALAK